MQAWTRRTTQQCFQQDVPCLSWRSDWDHANTVDNRQSNTKVSHFVKKKVQSFLRNRFMCLPWILCAQRCCWHHYYEFLLFLEKIETTRDDDPMDQQVLVLESSTSSGGSTNNDTGTAAPPYWILSRAAADDANVFSCRRIMFFCSSWKTANNSCQDTQKKAAVCTHVSTVTQHLNRAPTQNVHRTHLLSGARDHNCSGAQCQRAPPPLNFAILWLAKPSPSFSARAGLPAPTAVHITLGCLFRL